MNDIHHNANTEENDMKLEVKANWQTTARGTNEQEYQNYLACANDGNGIDITTGKKMLTFDEWMAG